MALFDEKYGDIVRVVRVNPLSCEFCGGTHAWRSGDLGLFTILSETAISAGVRRIEAVAGPGALQQMRLQKEALREVSGLLNSSVNDAVLRLTRVLERNKELERELERFNQKANLDRGSELAHRALVLKDGTKIVTGVIEELSPKQLREVADDLRSRIGSGCIALATVSKGKVSLLTAVTSDLAGRYHAGNLIKQVAEVMGSRGGGNADLAQAGGGDPALIDQALRRFQELVQ